MLFGRRRRAEEAARREAAGENLFTSKFSERFRTQVAYALRRAADGDYGFAGALDIASQVLREDEGVMYLFSANLDARTDLLTYAERCSDGEYPGPLEALIFGLQARGRYGTTNGDWPAFQDAVNELLREHRISYEMIQGHMVPFESRELHVAVVGPVLTLLGGRSDLDRVEKAYQAGLKQIADGHPDNAITDVATGLQEYLLALGCAGSTLHPLMESARTKGLLGPHDAPLASAIVKLADWVNADRVTMGDTHRATMPTSDDAWLAVHIVGALMLRVSKGSRRA